MAWYTLNQQATFSSHWLVCLEIVFRLVVIVIGELCFLLFLFEVFGIKPMLGRSSTTKLHIPALEWVLNHTIRRLSKKDAEVFYE